MAEDIPCAAEDEFYVVEGADEELGVQSVFQVIRISCFLLLGTCLSFLIRARILASDLQNSS